MPTAYNASADLLDGNIAHGRGDRPAVVTRGGTVTYGVLPNTTGNSRNHSITIAGNSFMVSQDATSAPDCRATLSPTSATVPEAGGSGNVAITIPAGCSVGSAALFASPAYLRGHGTPREPAGIVVVHNILPVSAS